jgi:tRNA G10  N-methylase Trm11
MHESFRKAEIQALAEVAGVEVEILEYHEDVGLPHLLFRLDPFCVTNLSLLCDLMS